MRDDLLIQRPDVTSAAPQLLLLFHGVGSSAEDLSPLGHALAELRSQSFVVSVRSPDPSDLGRGWQWFPVKSVTEANRPSRVAAAMPRFVEAVRAWQLESGIGAGATVLEFDDGRTVTLAVGARGLAEAVLRHDPPTAAELERAIDHIEDALAGSRVVGVDRSDLSTADPLLQALPGLGAPGSGLERGAVEALFQRLVSRALGVPVSVDELPHGRDIAAALLILREFMHHLQFGSINVEVPPAPMERPATEERQSSYCHAAPRSNIDGHAIHEESIGGLPESPASDRESPVGLS